jgi:hypothetical protein
MVTHGDEKVEEHLAAFLHLHLHSPAAFECAAAADDEGEVVSSQLLLVIRSSGVGPASRSQNHGDGNTGAKTLFAEGQTLEFLQAILLCSTALGLLDSC